LVLRFDVVMMKEKWFEKGREGGSYRNGKGSVGSASGVLNAILAGAIHTPSFHRDSIIPMPMPRRGVRYNDITAQPLKSLNQPIEIALWLRSLIGPATSKPLLRRALCGVTKQGILCSSNDLRFNTDPKRNVAISLEHEGPR
jgi:hypothetical protein